jgi:DNA-binding CsgD family transcriptional regulator
MIQANPYKFTEYENEVNEICEDFLKQRGLSYFHFRRNYPDGSWTILTNNITFLIDFLQSDSTDVKHPAPISVQQCLVHFWNEYISEKLKELAEKKHSLYHGITIVNRFKNYYDCAAFAMPYSHPHPASFYMHILNDLKSFSQTHSLLKKVERDRQHLPVSNKGVVRADLLLPQRSGRIQIASDDEQYVTTLEFVCMQLFNDGKSYKDIGEMLSISPRTVETHLTRMKRRTGLTFGEIALKSFKMIPKPESQCSADNYKNSYS